MRGCPSTHDAGRRSVAGSVAGRQRSSASQWSPAVAGLADRCRIVRDRVGVARPSARAVATNRQTAGDRGCAADAVTYRPPVDAPVIDPFRPPVTPTDRATGASTTRPCPGRGAGGGRRRGRVRRARSPGAARHGAARRRHPHDATRSWRSSGCGEGQIGPGRRRRSASPLAMLHVGARRATPTSIRRRCGAGRSGRLRPPRPARRLRARTGPSRRTRTSDSPSRPVQRTLAERSAPAAGDLGATGGRSARRRAARRGSSAPGATSMARRERPRPRCPWWSRRGPRYTRSLARHPPNRPLTPRTHPRSSTADHRSRRTGRRIFETVGEGDDHAHARRDHEATARGRRALRPPDPPLEPEDEALHLRRPRRHLHHRPAADAEADRDGLHLRPRHRRRRRHDHVRRHQEAGPGPDPVLRREVRHALRQRALARRHAHQLRDDLQAGRQDAGVPAHARLRRVRGDAEEGSPADRPRAREARAQPRRHRQDGEAAERDLRARHEEGAHRGHRGQQARPADRRGGRHQLRPRRHPVRHPRQRRRHPLGHPAVPGHRRRRRRGPAHGLQARRARRGSGADAQRRRGGRGRRPAGRSPPPGRPGGSRARGPHRRRPRRQRAQHPADQRADPLQRAAHPTRRSRPRHRPAEAASDAACAGSRSLAEADAALAEADAALAEAEAALDAPKPIRRRKLATSTRADVAEALADADAALAEADAALAAVDGSTERRARPTQRPAPGASDPNPLPPRRARSRSTDG